MTSSRQKLAEQLAGRLTPGAGRAPAPQPGAGLPGAPAPDAAAADAAASAADQVRARRSAAGREALRAGKVAEQWVSALCAELARQGALWWVQVPDPYDVVKRLPDGSLAVKPRARQHAADFVGAVPGPAGARLLTWEVKSVDWEAPSWGFSELRETQIESLDSAARLGACACVLLVALQAGTIARGLYVLPWAPGAGLPGWQERRSFQLQGELAQAHYLSASQALGWLTHPSLAL